MVLVHPAFLDLEKDQPFNALSTMTRLRKLYRKASPINQKTGERL